MNVKSWGLLVVKLHQPVIKMMVPQFLDVNGHMPHPVGWGTEEHHDRRHMTKDGQECEQDHQLACHCLILRMTWPTPRPALRSPMVGLHDNGLV